MGRHFTTWPISYQEKAKNMSTLPGVRECYKLFSNSVIHYMFPPNNWTDPIETKVSSIRGVAAMENDVIGDSALLFDHTAELDKYGVDVTESCNFLTGFYSLKI